MSKELIFSLENFHAPLSKTNNSWNSYNYEPDIVAIIIVSGVYSDIKESFALNETWQKSLKENMFVLN